MAKCWFCEKNQSDHDFEVAMRSKKFLEGTSDHSKWLVSDNIVPIPRCKQCAFYHRLRAKVRFKFLFFSVGLAAFIIIPLIIINPDTAGSLIPIIIVVVSLVVIMPAGEIYRKKKWPEMFEIKYVSEYSLAHHPKVAALIRTGFKQNQGQTEKLNKKK